MIKMPEYSEDVIVLVKYNNAYYWYLSEKSIWVLDYTKWFESDSTDMDELDMDEEREGIEILDRDNWMDFKSRNYKLETNKSELQALILQNLPILDWNLNSQLFPSLYVDFDGRILYSLFPESLEFERYVPENWKGYYQDFYALIPNDEKYWIIDGINYMPNK